MSWEPILLELGRLAEAWAWRVGLAAFIALVMWRVAHWSRYAFDRAARRTAADPSVRLLTGRLVYGAVLVLGLVWILGVLGLEQASLLATFGAVGLAISLATQDILKSFLAGLYLLFERPFLIGDEVQIKDQVGRVENVGFRATLLRTSDNALVVVPNAVVFAEVVTNRSGRVPPPGATDAGNDGPPAR